MRQLNKSFLGKSCESPENGNLAIDHLLRIPYGSMEALPLFQGNDPVSPVADNQGRNAYLGVPINKLNHIVRDYFPGWGALGILKTDLAPWSRWAIAHSWPGIRTCLRPGKGSNSRSWMQINPPLSFKTSLQIFQNGSDLFGRGDCLWIEKHNRK